MPGRVSLGGPVSSALRLSACPAASGLEVNTSRPAHVLTNARFFVLSQFRQRPLL
jgi:hypothetical protein